jgi:hypothetical protein
VTINNAYIGVIIMAQVRTCDTCGKIIKDKAELIYDENFEDGSALMKLKDQDWCEKCASRAYARMAMAAWEANKTTKKEKPESKKKVFDPDVSV